MNKEKRSPKTMTEIKQTMYVMTLLKVEAQHLLHKDHANRFKYESYNIGLILTKRQNNIRIFLIAAVVLNLAG